MQLNSTRFISTKSMYCQGSTDLGRHDLSIQHMQRLTCIIVRVHIDFDLLLPGQDTAYVLVLQGHPSPSPSTTSMDLARSTPSTLEMS